MTIRGILLDIEGTTSSISFVYDEMFPFVRKSIDSFLQSNWNEESVQTCLPLLANDLEFESVKAWFGDANVEEQQAKVRDSVVGLMDADVKATGLKQLQGVIWKDGFHSGELVAHIYDDVAPTIKSWNEAGIDVRIYSSGSIAAQKLFFGHCIAGNLLDKFKGHYDTTIGGKKDAGSYSKIANEFGLPPDNIMFVSDVAEELDAASSVGMQVALSVRPGNKPVENTKRFTSVTSFKQLDVGAEQG